MSNDKALETKNSNPKLHSFLVRLASSIVITIVILTMVLLGGYSMFAFTYLISVIATYEFMSMIGHKKDILCIYSFCAVTGLYALVLFNLTAYLVVYFVALLLLLMTIYVYTFPKYQIADITETSFILFYAGLFVSFIYQTRILPNEYGIYLCAMIFFTVWGSDTCAYCTGILIGKHKAFPVLSPKKTIEGCAGGVIGASLIGFLFGLFTQSKIGVDNLLIIPIPALFAIMGFVGAFIAQTGDLAASAMKRNYKLDDYGHLIPGHGGILDRFDSVIFTAPALFFLLSI